MKVTPLQIEPLNFIILVGIKLEEQKELELYLASKGTERLTTTTIAWLAKISDFELSNYLPASTDQTARRP